MSYVPIRKVWIKYLCICKATNTPAQWKNGNSFTYRLALNIITCKEHCESGRPHLSRRFSAATSTSSASGSSHIHSATHTFVPLDGAHGLFDCVHICVLKFTSQRIQMDATYRIQRRTNRSAESMGRRKKTTHKAHAIRCVFLFVVIDFNLDWLAWKFVGTDVWVARRPATTRMGVIIIKTTCLSDQQCILEKNDEIVSFDMIPYVGTIRWTPLPLLSIPKMGVCVRVCVYVVINGIASF